MSKTTRIDIDTRSLRDTASAWQQPNLIATVASETRATVLTIALLVGAVWLVGAVTKSWMTPRFPANAPTSQQISDFQQATLAACQQDLIARGYNVYSSNNCRQIASVATYNKFGKSY